MTVSGSAELSEGHLPPVLLLMLRTAAGRGQSSIQLHHKHQPTQHRYEDNNVIFTVFTHCYIVGAYIYSTGPPQQLVASYIIENVREEQVKD